MHGVQPPTLFGGERSAIAAAFTDWENVPCPRCGAEPIPFAVDYQGFQLCRCQKCQIQFLNPRPTFSQLGEKVYGDAYFESKPEPISEPQMHQFSHQLAAFSRLLGRDRGTLLDVGCGKGEFLQFAMDRGWEVAGTDIGLSPVARSLPCTLEEGTLKTVDFGSRRFDVIRFNHVLEHTQNPVEDLRLARALLTNGGLIFVSVPNLAGISSWIKNLQSRLHLKSHAWRHYAALHHLWFFTPPALEAVAQSAGLKVLEWETPVLKKPRQSPLAESVYRQLLGKTRLSSILDFYMTPDSK